MSVILVINENCRTIIVLYYKVVQTIITMFTEDKVTDIFFMADEFHKVFCRMSDKYSHNAPKIAGKRSYHRTDKLSVMNIIGPTPSHQQPIIFGKTTPLNEYVFSMFRK